MKNDGKIEVGYINTDNMYIENYKKVFKNAVIKNCDVEIQKIYEDNNHLKDNILYDEYIKLTYVYENPGLLLDGNFYFLEEIHSFFHNELFLAYKDLNHISTHIIWVKDKHNSYIKEILDCIKENVYGSIAEIISVISKRDLKENMNMIEIIDEKVYLYPYEYFFPIDYEHIGKDFSANTKALYYEKEIKLSSKMKRKIAILKKISPTSYRYLFNIIRRVRGSVGYKIYLSKNKIKSSLKRQKSTSVEDTLKVLDTYIESKDDISYIIFHNPTWLGVTSATKELFTNLVPLQSIRDRANVETIVNKILELGVKQVIFSAFDYGWDKIAIRLKELNPNIKLKSFWHGSHSQVIEKINWDTNLLVINLHKQGIIDVMGTCKESLVNFYKAQGYCTAFIQNTVRFTNEINGRLKSVKKNEEPNTRIGLYAAGVNWRKNTYNQMLATSLMENSVLELVPLDYKFKETAIRNNLNMEGSTSHIKREELIAKMASNNLNLYVTFSECAPMLPIESLEAGTVCITGNNHHYFDNTKLYDYLVVEREDDVISIYEKMKYALENSDKILEIYRNWKDEYDILSKQSVTEFIEM
ncbi:MAG: hypothetical protein PHP54_05050 [Clostridia bacterium]|nr:hypothetical protein [Clostridia bacterium]